MSVPSAWQPLQARERTLWIILACGIVAGVMAWGGVVPPSVAEGAGYAVYGSVIGMVIAAIRHALFRCPRCGHLYSIRIGPGQFPDRKPSWRNCLHCWLPKWADPHGEWADLDDEADGW